MRLSVIYTDDYKLHDTRPHVEIPERLDAVISGLKKSSLWGTVPLLGPRPATRREIETIHQPAMIDLAEQVSRGGGGLLDHGDTVASPESYDVACLAAGGALKGIELLISGQYDVAAVLCRPPGHHATPFRSMGFCIFNNAAIAVKYALRQGYERIGIVDWDVHHGNGIQDAFYDDPRVLYISIHRYPFFPGTGRLDETGEGAGRGFTINLPFPVGCGNAEYMAAFDEVVIPALKRFDPGLLVVPFGVDCHRDDPLGGMRLDEKSFAEIAAKLCRFNVPILMTLEGGYDFNALADSVPITLEAWVKNGKIDIRETGMASRVVRDLLKKAKLIHNLD